MEQQTILTLTQYKEKIDELRQSMEGLDAENEKRREIESEIEGLQQQVNSQMANARSLAEQYIGTLSQNNRLYAEQKEELKQLSIAYKNGEISEQSYTARSRELKVANSELNQILNAQQKQANATGGSFRDMQQTLAIVKTAYKSLSDEEKATAKGQELKAHLDSISQGVKQASADMGEFQMNVGNYAGGIIEAFKSMGIPVYGLDGAFKAASAGATGFKKALDLLKAHPIIAIAAALVTTFLAIKNAIQSNAELTDKWKVAMSAFQPVINLVKNVLDKLAGALVDVVSWVTGNMPKWIRNIGGFAKSVFNILGKIVDVIMFIPTKVAEVNVAIGKIIGAGVEKIAGGLANLLDAVGIDGFAAKLRNAASSAVNAAAKIGDSIVKGMKGAGSAVAEAGQAVEGWINKAASAIEQSQSLAKQQVALDKEMRDMEVATTKHQKDQANLRIQAAKATGEERKKILEQINKNEREFGEKRVAIAKKQYDLTNKLYSLSPTDTEGRAYLNKLKADVNRVEAEVIQSTVRNEKQITSLSNKAVSEAAKANKEAVANNEKALKKMADDSAKFVKEISEKLKGIKEGSAGDIQKLADEEKLFESAGLLTPQMMLDYSTNMHNLRKAEIDDEIKLLEESRNNTQLTNEDKLNLYNLYNKAVMAGLAEMNKYEIEQNKIKLKAIDDAANEQLNNQKNYEMQRNAQLDEAAKKEAIIIAEQYTQGLINYETYQNEMERITQESEMTKYDNAIKDAQAQADIQQSYMMAILAQFGEDSQYYKDAYTEWQKDLTKVAEEETNKRLAKAREEAAANHDDETKSQKSKEQKLKIAKDYAKKLDGIYSTVTDIIRNNIEEKIKEGKITEEEGEKQFEALKKAQIAQALINTFASAGFAIYSVWKDQSITSVIAKAVMSAVMAGEAITSGMLQVQNIKKQTLGSDSAGGSAGSAGAIMPPILNEALDTNSLQQIQTDEMAQQKDNRVYVVESDITNTQNKVQVRANNSTF